MKKSKFRTALFAVGLSLALFGMQGCSLYEKYGDCPSNAYLTVKAYATGAVGEEELTEATVAEVVVFVFAEDEKYLGNIATQLNENIYLNYPGHSYFHVVAIGNSAGGEQKITPVDGLEASEISLQSLTRAVLASKSPGDLFHGLTSFKVNPRYEEQKVSLPMNRKVGEMNITVRGISKQAGDTDSDYQIVVGETFSAIDFKGNLKTSSTLTDYKSQGGFLPNGDFSVTDFNMFPCAVGSKLELGIIYKGNLIVSAIDKDSEGNDIRVDANGKTNILIELGPGSSVVDVTIIAAQWGGRIPVWAER